MGLFELLKNIIKTKQEPSATEEIKTTKVVESKNEPAKANTDTKSVESTTGDKKANTDSQTVESSIGDKKVNTDTKPGGTTYDDEESRRERLERLKKRFLQQQIENAGQRIILYSDISGSGPYHEEERIWLEQFGEKYIIYHKIISPMAGGGEWCYSFAKDVSKSSFVRDLYVSLPHVHSVFPPNEAEELIDKLQNTSYFQEKKEEEIGRYTRMLNDMK